MDEYSVLQTAISKQKPLDDKRGATNYRTLFFQHNCTGRLPYLKFTSPWLTEQDIEISHFILIMTVCVILADWIENWFQIKRNSMGTYFVKCEAL